MRKLVVLLALVAFASVPGARAEAYDCASPCAIPTITYAYILPVEVIASGTDVQWISGDNASHPTSDIPLDQGPCFLAQVGPGAPVDTIHFTIEDGVVYATTNGVDRLPCTSAIGLPTGQFLIPFRCNVHPEMIGRFLIHS